MNHSNDIDLDCMFDEDAKYKKELEIILPIIVKASNLCMEYRNSVDFEKDIKEDDSPVTVADVCSQILINKVIMENFSNDLIIAEEDMHSIVNDKMKEKIEKWLGFKDWKKYLEKKSIFPSLSSSSISNENGMESSRFWAVDPIDGTRGYVNGEQFCICIALVINEKVVLSVVNCPVLKSSVTQGIGALFIAMASHGAFEVHLESQQWHRLESETLIDSFENRKLTETSSTKHASHFYSGKIMEHFNMDKESIKVDGQGKYCLVARKEAVIYFRKPSNDNYEEKIWDHAPGILIVLESGGKVFDKYGNDIVFKPNSHLNIPGKIVMATFTSKEMTDKLLEYVNVLCP